MQNQDVAHLKKCLYPISTVKTEMLLMNRNRICQRKIILNVYIYVRNKSVIFFITLA